MNDHVSSVLYVWMQTKIFNLTNMRLFLRERAWRFDAVGRPE